MPLTAKFRMVPYWTLARFGYWQEILDEPAPPATNVFLRGSWHYVRGLAFVATKRLPQAEQELETLREIMNDPGLDGALLSNVRGAQRPVRWDFHRRCHFDCRLR